ncbi:MAG: FAD-dependent oxidoreductase [Enterococcus sp.]
MATNIQKNGDGYVLSSDDNVDYCVDIVVLACGHFENQLTGEERAFADYAKQHQLFYQKPENPANVAVEQIANKEIIFIRGLGLSFFDYVPLFSTMRGGQYEEQKDGTLCYHPSGNEPTIYAYSGRGLPYHPRGINQKALGEQAEAHYSTIAYLEELRRQGKFTGQRFFDLLKKDVVHIYYQKIVIEKIPDLDFFQFEQDFVKLSETEFIKKYPELHPYEWDWDKVGNPVRYFEGVSFEQDVHAFLAYQIEEAEKGNCTGAFTSAIDALKDWREPIRHALVNHWFTSVEDEHLLREEFTRLNAFLTIGPPLLRSKQLLALAKAGIIRFLPPKSKVRMEDGYFQVTDEKNRCIQSKVFIEARIPETNLVQTKNPLLQQLINNGLGKVKSSVSDSQPLRIDLETNQVIQKNDKQDATLFCVGIPTEGIDWLTAAVARPWVDAWNLRQTDAIACQIIEEYRKTEN